ncbi:MAG: WD40 repeat domain-containing protein [Armatimonadetes bacterium]|nr:WD40 repeat domain-containing protein [Armatimonadota bacterium]
MRVRMLAFALAGALSAASFGDVAVTRVKTIDQFQVTAVAAAFSGSLFAFATNDNTVRIYDPVKMQTRFQLVGHPQTVGAIAFNRAGTLLATGDATARLYLWDVKTGKKVREFSRDRGHKRGISAIAFNADGSRIATVGNDDTICIWKKDGGNPVGTIHGKGADFYGVSFTSAGSIVTGTLNDGFRVYNGKTFALATKLPAKGINGIAATKDGDVVVSADREGRLVQWSVAKKSKVRVMNGHTDWAINAAVSPNGRVGASSSTDRSVAIWSLVTGQLLTRIKDTSAVGAPMAFTGDGKYFIATTVSDGLSVYSVSPAQAGATKVVRKKR